MDREAKSGLECLTELLQLWGRVFFFFFSPPPSPSIGDRATGRRRGDDAGGATGTYREKRAGVVEREL
jgi:hypothetical protein